jgi:hypothetical protein
MNKEDSLTILSILVAGMETTVSETVNGMMNFSY